MMILSAVASPSDDNNNKKKTMKTFFRLFLGNGQTIGVREGVGGVRGEYSGLMWAKSKERNLLLLIFAFLSLTHL